MTAAILYVTVTLAAGTGKKGKHFKMAGINVLSVLILSGVLLVVSAQAGVPLLQKAFGDVIPLRTRIQADFSHSCAEPVSSGRTEIPGWNRRV